MDRLLAPVLDRLDAIAGQIEGGLDETFDAFKRLQRALPDQVGSTAVGASVSVAPGSRRGTCRRSPPIRPSCCWRRPGWRICGDVLDARIRRYPAGQKPLLIEQRLRDLAQEALDNFAAPPLAPPDVMGDAPLGSQVSKLAVMGAMGPDIPAFANALQPGQAWVFELGAQGNARQQPRAGHRAHRSMSRWRSRRRPCRAFARRCRPAARTWRCAGYGPTCRVTCCHLAGDIVSHPFINDIEWHLGTAAQNKLTHADGEAAHDAMVAQRVYGRGGLRDGPDWENAWPKTGTEIPDQLFAAYAEALEAVLKAKTDRPKGLGELEHLLAQLDPPTLDDSFLRDGYEMLKGGIVRHVYGHGAPGWALLLTPAMLPVIALPFMALILPGLRFLPETGDDRYRTPGAVSAPRARPVPSLAVGADLSDYLHEHHDARRPGAPDPQPAHDRSQSHVGGAVLCRGRA